MPVFEDSFLIYYKWGTVPVSPYLGAVGEVGMDHSKISLSKSQRLSHRIDWIKGN